MRDASPEGHTHAGSWAETVHGRVSGIRHFGAFSELEIVAPKVAARASPGQFVMVTVPGGALPAAPPAFAVRRARRPRRAADRGARPRERAPHAGWRWATPSTWPGPLGSAFPVSGVASALLVGGGVGCAPLQFLSEELARRALRSPPPSAFATSAPPAPRAPSPSSGSGSRPKTAASGGAALCIDILAGLDVPPQTVVSPAGRPPMIAAVQRWSLAEGPARLRVARGAHGLRQRPCHGCVVDTARGRLRVCSEGPVFALDEVRPVTSPLAPDQVDLRVRLGRHRLAHPLVDASGTFDVLEYARRFEGDYFADSRTPRTCPRRSPWTRATGNPPPRVTETPAGMINAIGLENPGSTAWIAGLPRMGAPRRSR